MRLKMMAGGESIDYDALTATPEKVLAGETFLGNYENQQVGTMIDREKMHGAPGISSEQPQIPVHEATAATVVTVTNGSKKIVLSPPEGRYPGRERAFVGCDPRQLDILEENIAYGKTVGGIAGAYGSDGDLTEKDLKAGRVGYGRSGRVIGEAEDHGIILKMIDAGASYILKAGFYEGGKVIAKDLKKQTEGTAVGEDVALEKTAWVNGEKIVGSLEQIGAIDKAKNVRLIYKKLHLGMSPGIHKTKASSGYPEVCIGENELAAAIGLTADKLKKGTTLCGVTGTFEGWVPGNGDIYKNGTWGLANRALAIPYATKGAGVNSLTTTTGRITMEKGMFTVGGVWFNAFKTENPIDLTGWNTLNIECAVSRGNEELRVSISSTNMIKFEKDFGDTGNYNADLYTKMGDVYSSKKTYSINIPTISGYRYIAFSFSGETDGSIWASIYRIWLS